MVPKARALSESANSKEEVHDIGKPHMPTDKNTHARA